MTRCCIDQLAHNEAALVNNFLKNSFMFPSQEIYLGCSKTSAFGTATLDLKEKVGANLWFEDYFFKSLLQN